MFAHARPMATRAVEKLIGRSVAALGLDPNVTVHSPSSKPAGRPARRQPWPVRPSEQGGVLMPGPAGGRLRPPSFAEPYTARNVSRARGGPLSSPTATSPPAGQPDGRTGPPPSRRSPRRWFGRGIETKAAGDELAVDA